MFQYFCCNYIAPHLSFFPVTVASTKEMAVTVSGFVCKCELIANSKHHSATYSITELDVSVPRRRMGRKHVTGVQWTTLF